MALGPIEPRSFDNKTDHFAIMSRQVLILCTGNSCRSQMAEVLWRHLGAARWQVCSAGSKPSGYVHPMAIQAIQELDLPTDGLTSKSVVDIDLSQVNLVITVCDNAKNDCPVLPAAIQTLHWPFDDPADATGTDDEKMVVFRRVRDEIKKAIVDYLGVEDA